MTADGFCRKCGTSDAVLTRWHSILVCPACRPCRRCLDCGKLATEVKFAKPRNRRCDDCQTKTGKPRKAEPKQIAQARMNLRHLAWIRAQPCFLHRPECRGMRIHAHHERRGGGAGWAQKPDDRYALPLCARHHAEGHNGGWRTFERKYNCDLVGAAMGYAERSPFLTLDPTPQKVFPTAPSESEKVCL